jgi:hypothetical protein
MTIGHGRMSVCRLTGSDVLIDHRHALLLGY